MKQNVTVAILAAGLGTRMKSKKAKVLHEAGGDTLLNQVIRAALHVVAPDRIVAVVGHQAEQVKQSVTAEGVRFALQAEQKGSGHAVLCAREAIGSDGGSLLVLNGDGPLLRPETLKALVESIQGKKLGGAVVTTELDDPTGYGRIVRDAQGHIGAIVEQKGATAEVQKIREINTGLYCFDAELLWKHIDEVQPNNAAGEYYLTDMIEILTKHGHPIVPLLVKDQTELLGINTRVELAIADRILRTRKTQELMLAGVTIEFPESVLIDTDVEVGQDTVLEAGVQLRGRTKIGSNCKIGTGTVLRNCTVADEVTLLPYVVAEATTIERGAWAGPFARMRQNAVLGEEVHIGNFVELKKTTMGKKAKANHLAYLGDAIIGAGTNIGAGTITCNYDGKHKNQTIIADNVFVGSNSTLIAPVTISEGAYVAAGSTITRNVEQDALAVGRAVQVDKPGWAKRRRNRDGS